MAQHATALDAWCDETRGRHSTAFICERLKLLATDDLLLRAPVTIEHALERLQGYGRLREQGYIDADLEQLAANEAILLDQARVTGRIARDPSLQLAIKQLFKQYALEWEWERAEEALARFSSGGAIGPSDARDIRAQIDEYRRHADDWMKLNNP